MATIEAVPVAVANYVKQVSDPKEEELKSFFEENKERYSNPESPEPGFHRPHKVALEYFRADYDKFATPQTVTEAEMQQEYEKNKDYLRPVHREAGGKRVGLEEEPAEKKEQKPAEKKEQKPAEKKEQKPARRRPKPAKKTGEEEGRQGRVVKYLPAPGGRGDWCDPSPFVLTALAQDRKRTTSLAPGEGAEPVKKPEAAQGKPATSADVAKGPHPNPLPRRGDQRETEGEDQAEPPKTGLPGLPKPVLSEAMKNRIRRAYRPESRDTQGLRRSARADGPVRPGVERVRRRADHESERGRRRAEAARLAAARAGFRENSPSRTAWPPATPTWSPSGRPKAGDRAVAARHRWYERGNFA